MWWLGCLSVLGVSVSFATGTGPVEGVQTRVDLDGDGFVGRLAFGDDCDDGNRRIHPGAYDKAGDGVDQNCDGGDGWCVRYEQGPHGILVRLARLGDVGTCEGDVCEEEGPRV